MKLNCGAKFAKCVLFIFNVIVFIGGAAVLGLGIWIKVDAPSFTDLLNTVSPASDASTITDNILGDSQYYIDVVAYLLIGVGSFVFLVGFMGCCGAIKEWRPLLVGYAISLIIIVLIELGVGIAVGVYKDDALKYFTSTLEEEAIIPYYRFVPTELGNGTNPPLIIGKQDLRWTDKELVTTNVMNTFQVAVGCCGITKGYQDFLNDNAVYRTKDKQNQAPVFCCPFWSPSTLRLDNARCATNPNLFVTGTHNVGCVTVVENFFTKSSYVPAIIGVAVGIGLVELLGVFFAFCLCCAIGDKKKYR